MLSTYRIAFGVLCLVKSVDITLRGPLNLPVPLFVGIVVAWVLTSVAIIAGWRPKASALSMLTLAVGITVLNWNPPYYQHIYLIASICTVLAFARGSEVRLLLRAQVSIVYAFAALAKVNESFLSGSVVYYSAVQRPLWQALLPEPGVRVMVAMSVAALCTEAFLAVGFWFAPTRRPALIIGLGFHVATLVLMTADITSFVRLSVFALLMVGMYAVFFDGADAWLAARLRRRPRRPLEADVRHDDGAASVLVQ